MEYLVQQQVIRTIVSLCTLAAHSQSNDVRDDMRDQAAALAHLFMSHQALADYCTGLAARLEILVGDESQPRAAVVAAHACVLRLRASLVEPRQVKASPAPTPRPPAPKPVKPVRDFGGNQKKVLSFVASHPDIRTKEITDHFSGTLSDRTVQRCLKDLVSTGAIIRTDIKGSGVVTYRTV